MNSHIRVINSTPRPSSAASRTLRNATGKTFTELVAQLPVDTKSTIPNCAALLQQTVLRFKFEERIWQPRSRSVNESFFGNVAIVL